MWNKNLQKYFRIVFHNMTNNWKYDEFGLWFQSKYTGNLYLCICLPYHKISTLFNDLSLTNERSTRLAYIACRKILSTGQEDILKSFTARPPRILLNSTEKIIFFFFWKDKFSNCAQNLLNLSCLWFDGRFIGKQTMTCDFWYLFLSPLNSVLFR